MPEVSHLAFQAPHRDGQTEDWFTYSYLHFKNRTALSRLNMSTSCCAVWCTLKYKLWLQAFWMYKMSHWEHFNWTLFLFQLVFVLQCLLDVWCPGYSNALKIVMLIHFLDYILHFFNYWANFMKTVKSHIPSPISSQKQKTKRNCWIFF